MSTAAKEQALSLKAADFANADGMPAELDTTIHPDDQMLGFAKTIRGGSGIARAEYFRSGAAIMYVVRQLVDWKFGGFAKVGAFLDFASGFGRLTRFLIHELPPERLWISEIQADAVDFQQSQFGVHGLLSTTDPADFQCDQKFDCIFVASLFSHLPERSFVPWLAKLYNLLNPDGLLIFTTLGELRLGKDEAMVEAGIVFREVSEISVLDTREYGVSLVNEDFVRRAIVQATGQAEYRRIDNGLLYHQDIYLLINSPNPDFSSLNFDFGPGGTLDAVHRFGSDQLILRGWAADLTPDQTVDELRIYINGQLRQKCEVVMPRPDVAGNLGAPELFNSGWRCICYVGAESAEDDMMLVEAVSSSGTTQVVYLGSVGAILDSSVFNIWADGADVTPSAVVSEATLQSAQANNAEQEQYIARLEQDWLVKTKHIEKLERTIRQHRRILNKMPVRAVMRITGVKPPR